MPDSLAEYQEIKEVRANLVADLDQNSARMSREERENLTKQIRALQEMIELYEEMLDL